MALSVLLRAQHSPIVLGITARGLCDSAGAPLEKDPSELARKLHAMQFGTMSLAAPSHDDDVAQGIDLLVSPTSLSPSAFAQRLAEHTHNTLRLQAPHLSTLRASDPSEASTLAPSDATMHECTLLVQALLGTGAGAMSPAALAQTVNASLATQSPEQTSGWRDRLCVAIELIEDSGGDSIASGRARIAQAIHALEPNARALLTSPPPLSQHASPGARAQQEREQTRALKLLELAHTHDCVSAGDVLHTIERATEGGVLSPEAVMLCAKLCTLARADHASAARSDAALKALHTSIESVLRDPQAHGYTPEDYRQRLGALARGTQRSLKPPAFAGRTIDPRVQAACIAASIVQQASELGIDATGSLRFLTKRVNAIVSSDDAGAMACLASTLRALPTQLTQNTAQNSAQQTAPTAAPLDADSASPSPLRIAQHELLSALSETSCLMPLVKRAGKAQACEHALAILSSLPQVPIEPLATQYVMSGAQGLRRTLDVRLRAMPVQSVVELTHAMVAQAGITPHLLQLLEGLDTTRAHATMCELLTHTPASERRTVLEALVRTGAPLPPGLLATALIDEDPAIVALGIDQLRSVGPRASAFAIHAALVHLDGAKRLSAQRVELLCRAGASIVPDGAHALASLLDAWRWSLTGSRPRACSLIAEALTPVAQYDDAVRTIVRGWSRSSGRLVDWLIPGGDAT
jgi:hypothetical protein